MGTRQSGGAGGTVWRPPTATPPSAFARALMAAGPLPPGLAETVESCPGGWAVDAPFARLLANTVVAGGARSVLEIGAGSSSVVLAAALAERGGGRLTSVEQDPSWCATRWREVERHTSVDARLLCSRPVPALGRLGVFRWHRDSAAEVARRAPFDLLVVDGPQYFHGREGALPLAWEHLVADAVILLDDARRGGERWALWKWLRSYPDTTLDLLSAEGKGVAVLRKLRDGSPRLSPFVFLVGVRHGYLRWRRRGGGASAVG
jgi:predicted O-methyltransferase YrrM